MSLIYQEGLQINQGISQDIRKSLKTPNNLGSISNQAESASGMPYLQESCRNCSNTPASVSNNSQRVSSMTGSGSNSQEEGAQIYQEATQDKSGIVLK